MSDQPTSLPETDDAGYRVLARKYRPTNFEDLIGQGPMVKTLSNAFKTGRIAQAYMLTGVRGVGKTTTAINLGTALAAIKQKVVIIDLDPQGNASTGLGVPPSARSITAFDLLVGDESMKSAITPTVVPGLSILHERTVMVMLCSDCSRFSTNCHPSFATSWCCSTSAN